jgi:hypothetical protein
MTVMTLIASLRLKATGRRKLNLDGPRWRINRCGPFERLHGCTSNL